MLCPIRAIKIYLNRTKLVRKTELDFSFLLLVIMTLTSLLSHAGLSLQSRLLTKVFPAPLVNCLNPEPMNLGRLLPLGHISILFLSMKFFKLLPGHILMFSRYIT